jgi:phage baseplate assembly protein gpV
MALQTDLSTIQPLIESSIESAPDARARCLCRFDDGAVFAYAERGHEFIRASDHELWAVERDDALVSVRSGLVLAYRRGRVYFAQDNGEPVYYERAV